LKVISAGLDVFDSKLSIFSLTAGLIDTNCASECIVLGQPRDPANQFVLRVARKPTAILGPLLLVDVCTLHDFKSRGGDAWRSARAFKPGETCEFESINDAKMRVHARCVIVSGDLFWSLHVCREEMSNAKDV
jgi:hypothetical protein